MRIFGIEKFAIVFQKNEVKNVNFLCGTKKSEMKKKLKKKKTLA